MLARSAQYRHRLHITILEGSHGSTQLHLLLLPLLLQLLELCSFLEEQMGLVTGWLLAAPISLYLYLSPAKRVLGCVVAEAIKEASPVVPQLDAAALAQVRPTTPTPGCNHTPCPALLPQLAPAASLHISAAGLRVGWPFMCQATWRCTGPLALSYIPAV